MGFLAIAIVLLSAVFLFARLPATVPFRGQIALGLFMGSGYALLRDRGSLVRLPRGWHVAAVGGDRERALRVGCAGNLSKPIDTRTFGNQVRKLLAASRIQLEKEGVAP